MATDKQAAPTKLNPPATKVKATEFGPPAELGAEFGVQAARDGHIQGVVASENVRGLIDAFGLDNTKPYGIPFHHIHKRKGEMTSLRIEPAANHVIGGVPMVGHQWMYREELPERTA